MEEKGEKQDVTNNLTGNNEKDKSLEYLIFEMFVCNIFNYHHRNISAL